MNLNVLKSTAHFSRWGDSPSSMSLSFEVAPQGRNHVEIGNDYIFCATDWMSMLGKERRLVAGHVSISSNPEVLANLQPLFEEQDKPICGSVTFYPERERTLEFQPAGLYFNVILDPPAFAELMRAGIRGPGAAVLDLDIEGLEYGWEPDGSRRQWKLGTERREVRAISSFGLHIERMWTTEGEIKAEDDRRLNLSLAESSDPNDRKLASLNEGVSGRDPSQTLLHHCRALLIAILLLGVVALLR